MNEFFEWGDPSGTHEISDDRILELVRVAEERPFVNLLQVRQKDGQLGVVLEFDVERPQRSPVPIKYRERILLRFDQNVRTLPDVLALRKDFPDTPHQNLREPGTPQSLCLFEEAYEEYRPYITPQGFIDRISHWLKRAAVEELHHGDQPLEPLLIAKDTIIIDPQLLEMQRFDKEPILVGLVSEQPLMLYATPKLPADFLNKSGHRFYALKIEAPPWHARVIHYQPTTFRELSQLLSKLECDIEERVTGLVQSMSKSARLSSLENAILLIILQLPKTREAGGGVESTELWAFQLEDPLSELARKLGIADQVDGSMGYLLGGQKTSELDHARVFTLRSVLAMAPEVARTVSGLSNHEWKITVIGAGALGSQVVFNLARQGFASWTVIDYDVLYPHNFSRHALSGVYIGSNKAEALARDVATALNFQAVAEAIPASFLAADADSEAKIDESLAEADLVLDLSTSNAVTRQLSYQTDLTTRLTAFMTPSGRFLVALKEDHNRELRLTDLEQQLAAQLTEEDGLQSLYKNPSGTYAYAGACREVTTILPNDNIMVFAGILSNYIKLMISTPQADIRIWELTDNTGAVTIHQLEAHPIKVVDANGWQLRTSMAAIERMQAYRKTRLPNETGGVLLGEIDYEARAIRISFAIPSPRDSEEWPLSYRRGVEGLVQQIELIKEVTGDELTYIGEWHTHPDGADVTPSTLDLQAHNWLVEEMGAVGLPGLMVIIGHGPDPGYLVESD